MTTVSDNEDVLNMLLVDVSRYNGMKRGLGEKYRQNDLSHECAALETISYELGYLTVMQLQSKLALASWLNGQLTSDLGELCYIKNVNLG